MKDPEMVTEEAQLLPHAAVPAPSGAKKFFGGVAAALLVVAAGGVALSSSSSSPAAVNTELSSSGFQKLPTEVLLYKRTHISTDPEQDCVFLRNVLGMDSCSVDAITPTPDNENEYCGIRAEALSGNICFHNVKDGFGGCGRATPGPRPRLLLSRMRLLSVFPNSASRRRREVGGADEQAARGDLRRGLCGKDDW